MKNLVKKWWFWVIVIIIVVILFILISNYIENQRMKKTFANIGNSATDFISGIDNANSHLNEFSYNYDSGEVEYRPSKITLQMYNRIEEGMKQEEIISVLGKYENKLEGENTYILDWGDSNMSKGYWIRVIFSKEGNVISKSQIGLK